MDKFRIDDRVKMDSGRHWHGEVVALADAYPHVPMVTVRWDNNGRTQDVNVFMMDLVRE